MVIAVFQDNGSNNAGLKPLAVTEEKDSILLKFQDKYYQTMGRGNTRTGQYGEGGAEQATVYGFFVLPRSSKAVVIEEYHRDINTGQPVLDRQIKLPAQE
jgi:hypothetical protein